jgi:hypothetical protein
LRLGMLGGFRVSIRERTVAECIRCLGTAASPVVLVTLAHEHGPHLAQVVGFAPTRTRCIRLRGYAEG